MREVATRQSCLQKIIEKTTSAFRGFLNKQWFFVSSTESAGLHAVEQCCYRTFHSICLVKWTSWSLCRWLPQPYAVLFAPYATHAPPISSWFDQCNKAKVIRTELVKDWSVIAHSAAVPIVVFGTCRRSRFRGPGLLMRCAVVRTTRHVTWHWCRLVSCYKYCPTCSVTRCVAWMANFRRTLF